MSSQAVLVPGVWTAASNDATILRERDHRLAQANGEPEDEDFATVYSHFCNVLGINRHPAIQARLAAVAAKSNSSEEQKEQQPAEEAAPPATAGAAGNKRDDARARAKRREAEAKADKERKDKEREENQLRELSITGWTVDYGTVCAVALSVPFCRVLSTLKFHNAGLSVVAIRELAAVLSSGSTSVNRLYLDYNPVTPTLAANALSAVPLPSAPAPAATPAPAAPPAKGKEAAAAAAAATQGPTILPVPAADDDVFSELVGEQSPLQVLSLRGNNISDTAAAKLFAALKNNKTIISLNLWNNAFGQLDVKRGEALLFQQQQLNIQQQQAEAAEQAKSAPKERGAGRALSRAATMHGNANAAEAEREDAKSLEQASATATTGASAQPELTAASASAALAAPFVLNATEALADCLLYNRTLAILNLGRNRFTDLAGRLLSQMFAPQLIDKEQVKQLKKDGLYVYNVKNAVYRDGNHSLKLLDLGHNALADGAANAWLEVLLDEEERERREAEKAAAAAAAASAANPAPAQPERKGRGGGRAGATSPQPQAPSPNANRNPNAAAANNASSNRKKEKKPDRNGLQRVSLVGNKLFTADMLKKLAAEPKVNMTEVSPFSTPEPEPLAAAPSISAVTVTPAPLSSSAGK